MSANPDQPDSENSSIISGDDYDDFEDEDPLISDSPTPVDNSPVPSFLKGKLNVPPVSARSASNDEDDIDELERGKEIDLEIFVLDKGKGRSIKHKMYSSAAIENLKQYLEYEYEIPFEGQKIYARNPLENVDEKDIPNPLSLSDIETISLESKDSNKLWLKMQF